MPKPRTTLRNLRNYQQYLAPFLRENQPAYFEHLVAEAFSQILHLPLYTAAADDPSVPHRVTWFGKLQPVRKAPRGEDAQAFAHAYTLLIEPTLATGARQWTQEFGPCCRHYEDFVQTNEVEPTDVYVVLVATEVADRTWESVHQTGFNWILMTVQDLATVLQTSILAFTMTHSHLRQLFNEVVRRSHRSDSLEEFTYQVNHTISTWQMDTLHSEKKTFLAVRAYRAMRVIGDTKVSVGQIFDRLQRDSVTKQYLNLARAPLRSHALERTLLDNGLGCSAGQTPPGEMLLSPMPLEDFKHRDARIITALEEIDG